MSKKSNVMELAEDLVCIGADRRELIDVIDVLMNIQDSYDDVDLRDIIEQLDEINSKLFTKFKETYERFENNAQNKFSN